jgi:hypothetical protein
VYSVIVPPPVVVVVVVVVLDVCAQANGATKASAMLSNVFFILSLSLWIPFNAIARRHLPSRGSAIHFLIIRIKSGARFPDCGAFHLKGRVL